jgi:ribosomal-protein-alanine N-acetyltransferase
LRADVERPAAESPEALSVAPMTNADVRSVMRIESLSFASSWPSSAFASELNDNKLAHYFVGRPVEHGDAQIVAYGGIWVILDDAHITTIAVHPDSRGRRFGEAMLVHLLREAIERGASWITLEARESNEIAQRLYRKYGFSTIAIRRAYYSDNGENAVVMWAGNLRGELYSRRLQTLATALDAAVAASEKGRGPACPT